MAMTIERTETSGGSLAAHGLLAAGDGPARDALGRAAWSPAAGAPGLPAVLRDAARTVDAGATGAAAEPAVVRGATGAELIPAQEARTPAAPARDWTPEERAAIERGAAQGAADAGRGWVSDMVDGAVGAATVASQAAVVGLDAASRQPEPTGNWFVDGLAWALREANPLDPLLDLVDALIPDRFADAQARSLRDKGAALRDELAALPEMPRAVVEAFEAELALADALEGAYRAGRADLSVLEESARIRGQAVAEMGILAAELGATAAGGAGAAAKAARALGKLDLGDLPGGTLGALARAAEAGRSVAADVRAFAMGERGGASLGLAPGERLDRATLDFVRDAALGAARMSAREWMDLRTEAKAFGAGVERLSEAEFEARVRPHVGADDPTPNAGFDRGGATLVLRRDATFYEGFHELQHARQRHEIGAEAYDELSVFKRERYVFERVMANADAFSPLERGHAMDYILGRARKPDGDPGFRLPAAHRADYEAYVRHEDGPKALSSREAIQALDKVFRE